MYKTIGCYEFCEIMSRNGFSEVGAEMLFEFLTDIEDEDYQIEFDPVAIRCDFTEYARFCLLEDYGYLISRTDNYLRDLEELVQALSDETTILHNEDLSVFIVKNF